MPRPAHVSKRKPHGIPGLPRFNKLPMLCLKACSFKLSHCSFSLLTSRPLPTIHPREVPFLPSPACLGSWQVWPLLNQVVRPTNWAGVDCGVPAAVTFDSECCSPSFRLHLDLTPTKKTQSQSPSWDGGSMHGSPAQAATAQSPRCPRMPSREPPASTRLQAPWHTPPAASKPRGMAAGRPKRDRA